VCKGWNGIKVYYSDGRDDVHVEIPGEACEFAGPEGLINLWTDCGGKLRRFDVAIDGLKGADGNDLDPAEVFDMAYNRPECVRTKANLAGDESVTMMQNRKGKTSYIGAASSERRVRIYNARGPTRLELQVRGKRAESYGDVLEGLCVSKLPKVIVGLVRAFVDFVEPSSNKSRSVLQGWWSSAVESFDQIVTSIPKIVVTIESKWQWLQQSVRRTMAIMHHACVGDQAWLSRLLAGGESDLRLSDHLMIQQARAADWSPPLPVGSNSERGLFDISPLAEARKFLGGV
jgi:DNA relaxase NicK